MPSGSGSDASTSVGGSDAATSVGASVAIAGALVYPSIIALTQVTGVPCHVAENPLDCVALGTGLALEHFRSYEAAELHPEPGLTIVAGPNGATLRFTNRTPSTRTFTVSTPMSDGRGGKSFQSSASLIGELLHGLL